MVACVNKQVRYHNDANEIGTIGSVNGTPDWVDPAYDAAGNMTGRGNSAAPATAGFAQTLVYDAWNRFVELKHTGSGVVLASYEYDGLGRRIEKSDNIAGTDYDYYHNESWQVVEVHEADDKTNPLEQFVYDTNYIDALLMRWYDADTDGDLTEAGQGEQYYLYDASFCVVALLEADGDVIERYRYTPYGQRIVLDADFTDDADGISDYGQQRGFQG